MSTSHFLAIAALAAATAFTGLVLAVVLRARRLNRLDCCGLCGDHLGLESRFRFHGRTVCEPCSRRLRFVTVPRVGRVTVLLTLWAVGLAALAVLVEEHDPDVVIWGAVFTAVVASALMAGALPPLTRSSDRTADTLRRLHAMRRIERRGQDAEVE
jgi:hypothetical protein